MGWSFGDLDAVASDIQEFYQWVNVILRVAKDEEKEIKRANKKK